MIFGIDFSVINVNDDIQISISKNTRVGQRIGREPGEGRTTDEAGMLFMKHTQLITF